MNAKNFIELHLMEIQRDGRAVLLRKLKTVFRILPNVPLYLLAVPAVLVLRIIRPWLLVRCGSLVSSRIGHFAGNTELYLCERDAGINVPKQPYVDLFYMEYRSISNQQLAVMWKRVLHILPAWIVASVSSINRLIPGGSIHEIGRNTQHDRDVHNLLERFPPHLKFSAEEEARGEAGMRAMGIPPDTPFVCLIVRDNAYLEAHLPGEECSYHNYRDSDIQNYVLASEELADRDYFVIRMGAKVRESMNTRHSKVIDYATNGMRSDFMDIYLGSKCEFCISVGTGFDAVPIIFRRPIAYVNVVPLGYLFTFSTHFLGIAKHHFAAAENRELSLSEIFSRGVGFSLDASAYVSKAIKLVENTPEEIRDLVIEMAECLNGTWQLHEDDETLQRRFWEIYPTDAVDAYQGRPLHGEIRARFGASFLRKNSEWLQ